MGSTIIQTLILYSIHYTESFWVGDQSGQHNPRSGTNVLTHMEHVSITKGCHSANFLCLSLVLRSIHTYLPYLRRWLARLRSVNQFILYYIVYIPEKRTRESRAYIAFLFSSLSTLSITQSYFTWWRYTNNANKNMYIRQLDRDLNRESCMQSTLQKGKYTPSAQKIIHTQKKGCRRKGAVAKIEKNDYSYNSSAG